MFVYTKEMKAELDQKRIVKWITERGESTRSQLGKALQQRSKVEVDEVIQEMVKHESLIVRTKVGQPGRPCYLYSLPKMKAAI